MSPRFERRPSKRTGPGGRGSARPAPRGRQFGADGPRGGERTGDRYSDRFADRGGDRPGDRGGDRGGERRFDRGADRGERGERRSFERRGDRPPGRPPARFGERGDRPSFERRGERSGERGAGRAGDSWGTRERSDAPRFKPRRSDGERPRAPFRAGASRRPSEGRFGWGDQPRGERGRFGEPRGRSVPPLVVDRDRPSSADAFPPAGAERHGEPQGDDQPSDLIWGRHAAAAALEGGRPIHRIWCTPELRFSPKFLQGLREAKASGVLVEEVTWARLGQLTGGAVHQGIVLQPAAADTLDLASLIDGCRQLDEPPLLMALDGITDPHNLGAIARSAEALGAHGLVLPQRRSAGLTGSVAKVAAGALEHLPVARVVNLNRALDALKDEGYRVVGLAAEGSVSLAEADLDGPLVIVTGSEGDGLSMLTRKHCDQLVSIPLRGATPSLNASVATAMVLYEVARRGWMKGLKGGQPAPRIQRPQFSTAAPAAELQPMGETEPESFDVIAAVDADAADPGTMGATQDSTP